MKNVPWRMILLLVIIVLVALFSGFNLTPVEISLGFYVQEDVPLFLALIGAFIAGAVVMIPFTLFAKRAKKNKALKEPPKEKTGGRRRRQKKDEAITEVAGPGTQEGVSEE
jgi:uncharacterized integral membrane protein